MEEYLNHIIKREFFVSTKSKYTLTALLCSFFMVSLHSCGTGGSSGSNTISQNTRGENSPRLDANSQNPLIGTWVSGGYSLTFKSDNIYLRNFNQEGIPTVRGINRVSGNLIIVTDSDGSHSCINTDGQEVRGSYTYAISGNTLTFSLFHDPCSERAAFLGLTYTKQ
jgi:hypothetical protein